MNAQIIAIHDDTLDANSVGRIVFWTMSGSVRHERLVDALSEAGSAFKAPEEPSNVVALHRAVNEVARVSGGEAHQRKRGSWAIVGKVREETGELRYPIHVTASIEGDTVVTDSQQVRDAFDVARYQIAPQDISNWLCRCLDKLGAVSLRDSGGFYFVPNDKTADWAKVTTALKSASSHTIHSVPAMRSAEAVDAILGAITSATQAACDKISTDLQGDGLGRRALETRQRETAEILERVSRYEELLGLKLDALREATANVRAGVATAMLALAGDE
jgi:hypothetical protein